MLVYLALQICYEVYFIASYGSGHSDCASYVKLSLNVLFSFYTLISLYFIIKYTNVVINVNKNIARIFLMHAIGTSLTMWIYVIIWEAADAIAESDAESLGKTLKSRVHIKLSPLNESGVFLFSIEQKSVKLPIQMKHFKMFIMIVGKSILCALFIDNLHLICTHLPLSIAFYYLAFGVKSMEISIAVHKIYRIAAVLVLLFRMTNQRKVSV